MNINPLDTPGVPFEIELLNPNPSSSRPKSGPVYRVSFEVSKEVHDAFMASREGNLRIVARMSVLPDTDEQKAHDAVAGKKQKGPYGQMWKELFLAGFWACPGVKESLEDCRNSPDEKPRELMRKVFGVGSLSHDAGPGEIYNEWPPDKFPHVKVMVEQALRKVVEQWRVAQ